MSAPTDEPGAVVWCALCPTWAKTQVLLDGHVVRRHPDATGGYSTSAKLRRVEQERDELKADVDRMAGDHIRLLKRNVLAEAERDELKGEVERLVDLGSKAMRERDEALAKRDQMVENGDQWMRERNLARAELAAAQARHRVLWNLERDACVQLRRRWELTKAELATARAELERMRTAMDASLNRRAD